ncbi:MAG TPA: thioredoxin domain-containing protein [Solirubrobacteraceae bacterium]|nr:thioredoxin domain-containing protein [Solirubrobacteraceae bacterium]
MTNALARETSPYLRQHAENPVDWLPWGPVALARARELDRPLLVSIGYSACHWCHVMERESFADPATAALMNELFVCVKVDREERPDVDALYMEAVQAMTGHGGWPLNVFLTPEQIPFYGGTYFPPEARAGMPAWTQVLQAIGEAWSERAAEIRAGGERIRVQLAGAARLRPSGEPVDEEVLERAVAVLREGFLPDNGSFSGTGGAAGGATAGPLFPQASVLELLLIRGARARARTRARGVDLEDLRASPDDVPAGPGESEMALVTLRAMAEGGIHDVLAGGFARYSVDPTWTVPHFEKMLYDNALLARAYLHGFELSGEEALREVCVNTLDWALREMRAPEGGFYSALDADSEGVEGRYYVWTVAELEEALRADAPAAIAWLEASPAGNFVDPHHPEPGLNVLCARGPLPEAEQRRRIRERLLAAREARTRPSRDEKRLTSWNALMLSALADAGRSLGGEDGRRYLDAAIACAEFLLDEMGGAEGKLMRTYNDGEARIEGFLEDHAFLVEALLALFEATCEMRWLDEARRLADVMIARFEDLEHGGFFSTAAPADSGEGLIARRKEIEDAPIPAGGSSAALGLLRLAQLTGEEAYERQAHGAMALVAEIAPRHPIAFGHMLQAMHWALAPARPVACPVPGPAPLS